MKKILTIIIILTISSQSFACTCMVLNILDRHAQSDFVATVNILSVDSEIDNAYLNLEIEIIELFKGNKTNLLKIRKNSGGCAFYAPEKTKWLIFASKDQKGNLIFGRCSGPKQLDRTFDKEKYPNAESNYNQSLKLKLELLTTLKNENIEPLNTYDLMTSFPEESLEKFRGYEIKNGYNAFYEITVNKDLSVKNIRTLKEYDDEKLSIELINFIRENIHVERKGKLNEIPDETKIILGLYYHPSDNERQSIILPYAY